MSLGGPEEGGSEWEWVMLSQGGPEEEGTDGSELQ